MSNIKTSIDSNVIYTDDDIKMSFEKENKYRKRPCNSGRKKNSSKLHDDLMRRRLSSTFINEFHFRLSIKFEKSDRRPIFTAWRKIIFSFWWIESFRNVFLFFSANWTFSSSDSFFEIFENISRDHRSNDNMFWAKSLRTNVANSIGTQLEDFDIDLCVFKVFSQWKILHLHELFMPEFILISRWKSMDFEWQKAEKDQKLFLTIFLQPFFVRFLIRFRKEKVSFRWKVMKERKKNKSSVELRTNLKKWKSAEWRVEFLSRLDFSFSGQRAILFR